MITIGLLMAAVGGVAHWRMGALFRQSMGILSRQGYGGETALPARAGWMICRESPGKLELWAGLPLKIRLIGVMGAGLVLSSALVLMGVLNMEWLRENQWAGHALVAGVVLILALGAAPWREETPRLTADASQRCFLGPMGEVGARNHRGRIAWDEAEGLFRRRQFLQGGNDLSQLCYIAVRLGDGAEFRLVEWQQDVFEALAPVEKRISFLTGLKILTPDPSDRTRRRTWI
ncbi:MAG: hypothetical protein GMKNLPBB_02775 [Myxococcota bacterium]|nr:hypothetical protein [Myxococcota bacterium]